MNKLPIICALAAVAAFPQAQTPLTITQSAGSATGELRMQERRTNGTDYVGIKAPQSVATSTVWTLPSADGTSGQCLQTDGAAVLSFSACAGYWTLSGSDIYRSTGLVTIGHTTPTVRLGQNLNTNYSGNYGGMALNTFSATGSHGSVLDFNKSASGTLGAHGAVASGDTLGFFVFRGSDGAAFQRASEVLGEVDGTVFSGVVPGRIRFRTANSSGTMTEAWRIDKNGAFRPGADDIFSLGLTGTRVLGVYAKFGEFYKSGSTASSDYLTTRKYNILDQSGGSGAWDIQSSGSMAATSSIKIRDNAGSRWLEAYRAISGTPLKYTSLFGHLYPAKRVIADGDAVDDTVFGDLGATSARWANIYGATANFTAMTIATGSTTGYVWTDTGSGVGAWQAGGLDAYDVRNFGAVCDGTTDDTTAISNAISAGAANKHKAILPQGTCKVTTISIANSYGGIRGQGRNNSILSSTTNAPIIKVDNAGPLYYLEFSDLTLKGSGAGTSQNGIESATAGFGVSTIHNVYFDGLWRGVKLGHTTNLGDNNILDCAFSMSVTNSVGIESLHTSSGSIWSRNFFGGTAEALGATSGNRAFYLHGYVGDTVMNDNHMEGGWIGFDISCDNGTFATGICSYGENLVITGNKIDGYALDFRLYNLHNSTILGNRGRGVLDAQITGTSTSGMIYDVVGRVDSGSAIERAGFQLTTSTGDTAINAYDEGRIRLGTVTSNLSSTRNGISIQDLTASSGVALGQSTTRNMGMLWNYNATAGSAYGLIYTYSYANPMVYGASSHQFVGADGPALGAGQNISPVWLSGTSGFIGYGLYRTDDTNGGWLIGTSGLAVGDFAIYQNQGAGSPVRRFSINPTGSVDVAGALTSTALTINTGAATVGYVWTATSTGGAGSWQAAGSSSLPVTDTTGISKGSSDATKILRFEVDGFTTATTRVLTPQNNSYTIAATDIAQTFSNTQTFSGTLAVSGTVGDDFVPNSDGTYVNGTTSFRWGSIATYNADFNGVLTFSSGTTFTGSFLPTTNNLYAVGNTSLRLSNIATVNANISGTITTPSGSAGITSTKTVRDSAGTGTCTLIFSGGILTGGTC